MTRGDVPMLDAVPQLGKPQRVATRSTTDIGYQCRCGRQAPEHDLLRPLELHPAQTVRQAGGLTPERVVRLHVGEVSLHPGMVSRGAPCVHLVPGPDVDRQLCSAPEPAGVPTGASGRQGTAPLAQGGMSGRPDRSPSLDVRSAEHRPADHHNRSLPRRPVTAPTAPGRSRRRRPSATASSPAGVRRVPMSHRRRRGGRA